MAKLQGLDIKKIYTEAKSAKKPDNRPIFKEMLERIEKGEANGILCWQLNRLSRNPVDSGKLGWLLQQGVLKSIKAIDKDYLPEDNVILFNVETGAANQFIIDLRKNTKRGVDRKVSKGWLPSHAPLGYINDKYKPQGEKTILKDLERFNLVRRMWDLMLTGNYTPPQICEIANKEWGFKTPKLKKRGGDELAVSTLYKMFGSIFYTGRMLWAGKEHEGKHDPMITMEEFDRVQVLLGRKGRPRNRTFEHAFTGIIRCGECGYGWTETIKKKFVKSENEIREYHFYHCSKRSKTQVCKSERLTLKELETQIEKEIDKYEILPEFLEWGLEEIESKYGKTIEDSRKVCEMQAKTIAQTKSELDNLTRMRYKDLIDDETFVKEQRTLKTRIKALEDELAKRDAKAETSLELTKKTFDLAAYAHIKFLNGDLNTKREIFMALGENHQVTDQKLSIQQYPWLSRLENGYSPLEKEYLRLELNKMPMNAKRKEALASIRSRWGA